MCFRVEFCGFSCLFILEVYRYGRIFWRVFLEIILGFLRDIVGFDFGMIVDIFSFLVWVNWSMFGGFEERLYCCFYDLFSVSICFYGRGGWVLEVGRFRLSFTISWF